MKKIGLSIIFILTINVIYSQEWKESFIINGSEIQSEKSVLDNNNNLIVLAEFKDTIFIQSSEILSSGFKDLLLMQISPDGELLWFKHIAGANKEFVGGLSTDNENNIYITGSSYSTCYFSEQDSIINSGSNDGFLAKYDNSGQFQLANTICSNESYQSIIDHDFDIANNKLVVTGIFTDSIHIGNDINFIKQETSNSLGIFISTFELTGEIGNANFFESTSTLSRFFSVKAMADGYYLAGGYINSLYLNIDTLTSTNGNYDICLLKTDFHGNENWIRRIFGSGKENFQDIQVDKYNNLYVLGNSSSTVLSIDSTNNHVSINNKNAGGFDTFIGKYNKSGNLQWYSNIGGKDDDLYLNFDLYADLIFCTGYFADNVIFNQDTLSTGSQLNKDIFLATFNNIGDPIGGISIPGEGDYLDGGTTVNVDVNLNAYVTGYFGSSKILIGENEYPNQNTGTRSFFYAKYYHPFEAVFTNESNPTCNGATDGMLTTTPYFGVPPYTYSWSHDAGLNDSVAANLSAGTYTVTITDSRDSTAIGSATVGQPQPILVDFDIINTTCYNGNDGALDITVTGGNNEYDYTWDGGVGLEPKEEDQTGLYAGTYYLTITDQKNCTKLDTVEISQPGKIRFNPSITPSGEGLSNGAIDLTPEGGNPPYNFAWSGPSSFTETTEDVTGLAGGTYNVTITHDASCSADTSIFVPEENQFQIYISNVEHISCYGASDGSASVSVENESGLLAYTWYDSTKVNIVSEFAAASNLDSGKYYVRVEDQFPHVAWDSVVIQQPDSLYFSRFFRSQVQCNGENTGYIDVEIDGGTPVYTYQWAHGPTSENLTGLAASDEYYKVTVTDANGCTSADSGKILEPDPLLVTIDKQDPLCPGTLSGIATANASGGVQPYDYVWNDPGNQTEKQATALPAGNFTVTVTDFAGCIKTASTALNDPAPIQITSVDVTHINCHGSDNGSVSVDVTGGTGSYDYTWNHSSENSGTVNSLAPGDYSVIVTDANNCTPDTAFATITEPDTVIIDITTTQIDCHGQEEGEILINASGGSGSFTYEWGHTTSGFSELGGLAAGTYDVTVSDGQCPPFEYSLEISEPEALSVDIDTANATCHGDNDGAITISVTGGTGSYSYSWSHTATDTNRFTNLLAGNYSVTVSDGACPLLSYENIPVTQPDSFYIASIDSSHVSEFGARDGFIQVNMSGGIPPLRYSLNGGTVRETNAFNDLGPGMYTVVINDANQCGPVSTGPIEIKEPPSAISGVWKSNEISIFPNPARNTVYLRFQGLQEDIIQVRIVNILGELIFDSTYRDVLQNNVLEINTEEFSTGTYFMIINNKRAPHPLIID